MDIFKLVGSIFIDNKEANNSLSKTEEKAGGVGSKLVSAAEKAGKFALGLGAAAATGATALYKVATSAAETSDKIDKMSQRLGISREAYQELDFALSQSGVNIDSFSTGAKTLLKNMDALTEGNKTATANFEALGVQVVDVDGKMRSQEDVLFDTIAAFQGMENSAEKSRLAQEMFGKQGQEILPMLNSESASIDELRQQARDLGLVLDNETIDAGVKLNDTLDQAKRTFDTVVAKIGTAVMPIVQKLLDWILEHMPEIQSVMGEVFGFINQAIETLVPIIKALTPVFKEVLRVFRDVWENGIKPILSGIIDFISGVFTGNWEKAFNGLGNIVKGVFNGLVSVVKLPINAVIGIINGFIGGLNRLKIPDWVPGLGGMGINIPQIPYLAKGGEAMGSGSAIVGEDGAELINLPKGATVTPLNANNNAFVGMERRLEDMQNAISSLAAAIANYKPQIILDSGVLVGEIAPSMDNELGRLSMRELRGV